MSHEELPGQAERRKRLSTKAKVWMVVGAFCAMMLLGVAGFVYVQLPTALLVMHLENQPSANTKIVLQSFLPWNDAIFITPTTWWQRMTSRVERVTIFDPVAESTIQALSRLRSLKKLSLYEAEELIHEEDLAVLAALRELEMLRLPGNVQVGDATLKWIGGLKDLRELQVWGAGRVTAAGFGELSKLDRLEKLVLVRLDQVELADIERVNHDVQIANVVSIKFQFAPVGSSVGIMVSERDRATWSDLNTIFALVPPNEDQKRMMTQGSRSGVDGTASRPFYYRIVRFNPAPASVSSLDVILWIAQTNEEPDW